MKQEYSDPTPPYISGLKSALRELPASHMTQAEKYNAFERDIAELNIYFGMSTALGK